MNVSFSNINESNVTLNPATLQSYGTVTAGDVLLLQFCLTTPAINITGITGGGNTWQLLSAANVGTYRFETWWVPSCLASAVTPIVTFSGTPNFRYTIYRVSNITGVTAGPVATLDDTTPSDVVTMAPITLVSGGIAFSIMRQSPGQSNFPFAVGGSFINAYTSGSPEVSVQALYRLETSGFAGAPTVSLSSGGIGTGQSQTVAIYGTITNTRWYPTLGSTGTKVLGAAQGVWTDSFNTAPWYKEQVYYELKPSKFNSGRKTVFALATNIQGNFDSLVGIIVTPPLQATTLSGTLQLCLGVGCCWNNNGSLSTVNTAKLKIFAYISQGASASVRTILINNILIDIPSNTLFNGSCVALPAPVAVSGAILEGDRIFIEVGVRIVSSPIPAPTYPPTQRSQIPFTIVSPNKDGNESYRDMIPGSDAGSSATWVEFSQILIAKVPDPPANDACADAIEITEVPYQSDFIDTTGSLDIDRAVWWKWTPTVAGHILLHGLGSNYNAYFIVYRGSCGALINDGDEWSDSEFIGLRSFPYLTTHVDAGTTYYIKVYQTAEYIKNHGGALRVGLLYLDGDPAADDVYLNSGWACGFREGQLTSFNPFFLSYAPIGVAIDYSEKPIIPQYDPEEGEYPHVSHRLVVGLHHSDMIEILDLKTMDVPHAEVGFHTDYFGSNTAQIYIDRTGFIYVGWFGNGYLCVLGAGSLPAIMNAISNAPRHSSIKKLDIGIVDSQYDLPVPPEPTDIFLTNGKTSSWAFTIDETANILYYTTSGFYVKNGPPPLSLPIDENNIIRRFDLNTNTALPDFATVTLEGLYNTGLKGLALLADGGLLVANGSVVTRLNADGGFVRNYTPSENQDEHLATVDVKLTVDWLSFWMHDLYSTRMTRINLDSGEIEFTFQPYLRINGTAQIAVYNPDPVAPPDPTPIGGIYKMVPGKTDDTLYVPGGSPEAPETVNVKIPDPSVTHFLEGAE